MHKFTSFTLLFASLCGITFALSRFEAPETVYFESGPAPRRGSSLDTHLWAAKKTPNGILDVSAFLVVKLRHPGSSGFSFTNHLKGIKIGDVFPVLGELYEVDSIHPNGGESTMRWKRLSREKWPEGAKSTSGSVVVLLDSSGRLRQTSFPSDKGQGLSVTAIHPTKEKELGLTANLLARRFTTGKPTITLEATVKENDILLIDGKGHKVLSIVPANAITRVVGWVELDPVGIPEADLKRDKKAYITPTAVKK